MSKKSKSSLDNFKNRINKTLDGERKTAQKKRHEKGFRTARENLDHLVDTNSFIEYGQLAVAAQRSRREYEDLMTETAADGIITGMCKINSELVGADNANALAIINDYSVLAGTQGFFHHKKLDRICELASDSKLSLIHI